MKFLANTLTPTTHYKYPGGGHYPMVKTEKIFLIKTIISIQSHLKRNFFWCCATLVVACHIFNGAT